MGSFVKILNKEDISLHKNRDTIREVSIHINQLALAKFWRFQKSSIWFIFSQAVTVLELSTVGVPNVNINKEH